MKQSYFNTKKYHTIGWWSNKADKIWDKPKAYKYTYIGKIRNVSYTYPQSGHRFTTNRDWVCVCSISENFLDLTNFVQNICVTNCKDFKNVLEFDLFLFLEIYSLCQILQKWFFAKMLFIFFFNICLLMSFLILLCKQVWWKRNPILSKRGMLFPQ